MCFDDDSYKCIYSKQTQQEATTKQTALAAGAKGRLLCLCVRGGTSLAMCASRSVCACWGFKSFALGVGCGESVLHHGIGVMRVWLNVACCSLHCLVASPGVFGELSRA